MFLDVSRISTHVFFGKTELPVPEIERIGSLILMIYFNDFGTHRLPHFHVDSPDGRAVYAIADLVRLAGSLRARDEAKVLDWAAASRQRLAAAWNRCNPDHPIEIEE